MEQHLEQLGEVLAALRSANLKHKLSKCSFGQFEVKTLVHVKNKAGVRPDRENIRTIRQFSAPREDMRVAAKIKLIRNLVGLCSYYRCFVLDYA